MKTILLKIGTVLFILLLISSCKKYDEGPWISFRTKEKRIIGTWEVNKFYVNGNDSSQFFLKYDSPIFSFEKSSIYISLADMHRPPENTTKYLDGYWDFIDNKKGISMSFETHGEQDDSNLEYGPFQGEKDSKWEIKKLKTEEFYLETDFENSHYRLELKRR